MATDFLGFIQKKEDFLVWTYWKERGGLEDQEALKGLANQITYIFMLIKIGDIIFIRIKPFLKMILDTLTHKTCSFWFWVRYKKKLLQFFFIFFEFWVQ